MAGDTPALDALLGVVALLKEHYDVIDADFQRFYGLDLGGACWGEDHVGVRRLIALITGLPPESTLARQLGTWWTERDELSAALVELTHGIAQSSLLSAQTGWAQVSPKGKKFPKPEQLRIPRPGDEDPDDERRPVSRADVRKTLLRK